MFDTDAYIKLIPENIYQNEIYGLHQWNQSYE